MFFVNIIFVFVWIFGIVVDFVGIGSYVINFVISFG